MWLVAEIPWYGRVQDIFNHVLVNLEDLTNWLLEAASLEEAFHLIKGINYIGDFYAYQIVCDMVEIGLLRFRCESFSWSRLLFLFHESLELCTLWILVKTHGLASDLVHTKVFKRWDVQRVILWVKLKQGFSWLGWKTTIVRCQTSCRVTVI